MDTVMPASTGSGASLRPVSQPVKGAWAACASAATTRGRGGTTGFRTPTGRRGGMAGRGQDQEQCEDHQAPVPDVGDGALRGGLPGGIEKAEVEDVEGSAGGRRLETDGRS